MNRVRLETRKKIAAGQSLMILPVLVRRLGKSPRPQVETGLAIVYEWTELAKIICCCKQKQLLKEK